MKKIGICQSNYIPWKGYFDLINECDVFVFLDEVQYTKQDWRNRNLIQTSNGNKWLTIPVGKDLNKKIFEVKILNNIWQKKHRQSLQMSYGRSEYFDEFKFLLDELYLEKNWDSLSEFNQFSIKRISKILEIKTELVDSREFKTSSDKNQRLIDIIKNLNGDVYITGRSAMNYLDEEAFKKNNIKVSWKDYKNYPEYKQRYPKFEHKISILDVIFNVGFKSNYYIWEWRKNYLNNKFKKQLFQ